MFEPLALLREARRQEGLPAAELPEICVLDPTMTLFAALKILARQSGSRRGPCHHTDLHSFVLTGQTIGIVGFAGAVLVADRA